MLKHIINLLNKLKNASLCKKKSIKIIYNLTNKNLIKSLYNEGLIQSVLIEKNFNNEKYFKIFLKYFYGKSVLKNLKFFSKLFFNKYNKFSIISQINSQKAITAFFFTHKGIFNHIKCQKYNIGGKLIFIS